MGKLCALALVLICAAGPLGRAQAPAADWLTLEGNFAQDARPGDVNMFLLTAQRAIRTSSKQTTASAGFAELANIVGQAYRARNLNLLWRFTPRLVAAAAGKPPGEWIDVATSLDFETDHSVIAPGQSIHVTLKPQFVFSHRLKSKYVAEFAVVQSGNVLARSKPVEITALEEFGTSLPTRDLKPGIYKLRYELKDEKGEVLAKTDRRIRVEAGWTARARKLAGAYERALLRLGGLESLEADAAHFVGFVAQQMQAEASGHGAGFPDRLHPATVSGWAGEIEPREISLLSEDDLATAEKWASEIAAGRNPIAAAKGWLRLASKGVDGNLRAYRLHLPEGKASKMIVAMHGSPGWDGSYLNEYSGAAGSPPFAKLAADKGYLALLPSTAAMGVFFEGGEAEELMRLIRRIRGSLAAGGAKLFLAGHQTGGGAAIEMGILQGLDVAAVASSAGIPDPVPDPAKNPKAAAVFIGSPKDWEYPEQTAYRMKAMFKRGLARFESVDVERTSDLTMAGDAVTKMFEFFESVAATPVASPQP